MKNAIIRQLTLNALILALFTSCISSQSFMPVKGIGSAIEKSYDVSGFNGIDVSGGFDVILSQGESESVVLRAQENLYEYIHVEVDNGILRIYTKNNLWPTRPLEARIMFRDINRLNVSGGGDVTAETIIKAADLDINMSGGGDLETNVNADDLSCHISGGGDANINGSAAKINIQMTGGGDLESTINAEVIFCSISGGGDLKLMSDKEATEVRFEITGGGDADARVNTADLNCFLSGGGNAKLYGKATNLNIHLTGGGDVHASGLDVTSAIFEVSGGSDLHLQVKQELKGNITGGGDLYYSGSPEIVSVDARGGSEVHRQ